MNIKELNFKSAEMRDLFTSIAADSNVVSGNEYRNLICAVSQVASDMVIKTLGPYGSTTVIDEGTGFTYPTKDGWSCLNRLQFTDPTYNSIFSMLKKISFNSVATVGDGTTTAMVAANYFVQLISKWINDQLESEHTTFRQADFLEAIRRIHDIASNMLRENPNIQRIDMNGDFSDIRRIAYIATNGNDEISDMIQKIYQDTKNPNINVQMDKVPKTVYDLQVGYKFDARVLNYRAYVNNDSGTIDYRNHPVKMVIFDHNVTFQGHERIIGAISNMAARDNNEVVILAPYFDDIITSWIDSSVQKLVQNRQRPMIMLVQVPTTLSIHRKTLSDLAVLVNAQIFDDAKSKAFNMLYHNQTHDKAEDKIDDPLLSLKDFEFKSPEDIIQRCMGNAKSLIINTSEGFLQDYESTANETYYRAIMDEASDEYHAAKRKAEKVIGGTLDKEYLFKQMRYIKLTGQMGLIRVGGFSDIQQRCDKDTIDDAVLACKSAFEYGYVRGLNIELLSILNTLRNDECCDEYEKKVADFLYYAFFFTAKSVIDNKYGHSNFTGKHRVDIATISDEDDREYTVVSNLTADEILEMATTDAGVLDYDLRTDTMHGIGAWNVINSTATDIEILKAVVNVLTTVLTSCQFLSVTRRYNQDIHNASIMEKRKREDREYLVNKLQTIYDFYRERNLSTKYSEGAESFIERFVSE